MKILRQAKPSQRRALLKVAHPELIKTICECAQNLLKGTAVSLSPATRRKLYPHRKSLRKLQNKRLSIASKKKFLVQKGGFLPLLISALAPVIGGLGGSALG